MDLEKRARRQSLRVIISETIMVLSVIAMVAVLALIVSGYWLNSDFEVERQGMLQIGSTPTGASVEVDGSAPWYQRTNTSKVLSAGEHKIVLTRDGYDSWAKTVTIREGLLYRLNYPRLFLTERELETVLDVTTATFATVSKDHNTMLLADNTTVWRLLRLNENTISTKTLDIAPFFSSVSIASTASTGLFTGKIINATWSGDNNHVLIQATTNDSVEWVLLDIRNPERSINLSRQFAADFTDMRIFDSSASTLLTLRNGNLHKIDVASRQISAILAEAVLNYNYYDQEIIYTTPTSISILKNPDSTPIVYRELATEDPITGETDATTEFAPVAFISRFYDDKYITIVTGDNITVYNYDDETEVFNQNIAFIPENIRLGQRGDYLFLNLDTAAATLDMESLTVKNWALTTSDFGWLDNNMLYEVAGGTLSVYDYDGLNHRTLSKNVSAHFPVVITNNKWMYYFSDGNLVREIIAK